MGRLWSFLTFFALFVSGLSSSRGQDTSQPNTVIVPLGGTFTAQMKSKKAVKTILNPKDNVLEIRPIQGDPTTLLFRGLQPDVATVVLSDADGGKENVEVIVRLDLEYVKTQLRRAMPSAKVTPIQFSNNTVLLTGTVVRAGDEDILLRVAQGMGGIQVINAMRVGGVQQVQLNALVASVTRTIHICGLEVPINPLRVFFGGSISQVQCLPVLSGTEPPMSTFFLSTEGGRLLTFLKTLKLVGLTKFITQPSLVTLSGRPATFLVGGQQAVPVVSSSGSATGIQFEPFGTQLQILPTVLANGKIHLEANTSITDLDAAFGAVVLGNVVPGRRQSSLNTTVQLESGQTMVITGLKRRAAAPDITWRTLLTWMPFLDGLIDVKESDEEEEVLVLMTPYLIEPQDCRDQVADKTLDSAALQTQLLSCLNKLPSTPGACQDQGPIRRAIAALQGSWTRRGEHFSVNGDRWSWGDLSGTVQPVSSEGDIERVDLLVEEGPTRGQTVQAIFQREGNLLHYCGSYGPQRPQEFKTQAGNCWIDWRRSKSEREP